MAKKKKKITKKEKDWIDMELQILSNTNNFRLRETIEPNSNFINLAGGYFNKGKYKGIEVSRASIEYLDWLLNKSSITLNKGETKLLNKLIKKK